MALAVLIFSEGFGVGQKALIIDLNLNIHNLWFTRLVLILLINLLVQAMKLRTTDARWQNVHAASFA